MATAERTQGGPTFVPRFDILETGDELTLFGDLPGVNGEDLDIRFENNQLVVHGKVAARHENREYLYGEYGIGDFYRVFNIGESIDSSKISAELNNGTLTLHLPKAEAVKPRKIAVKCG
ncbi:MAG: Hsp20/alpha crystallin family protein [Pirellulales bacterium]|nr:Hsp20/alpha crystallin family protein [Pirellulales bacterium]